MFIELKKNTIEWIKLLFWGTKQVLVFPNLFTHYERDMTKLVILLDYYNNVYEGYYEKW
jgi:hypothetical protein